MINISLYATKFYKVRYDKLFITCFISQEMENLFERCNFIEKFKITSNI